MAKESKASDLRSSILIEALKSHRKADNPIPPEILGHIPYFEEVFKEKEFWPVLVELAGSDGIAHIELKKFKQGETIIELGKFDQMIYWVIKGNTQVITKMGKQPKIIHTSKKGECIGELGVIKGLQRTAHVVAGKEGAELIEVDWAITDKDPELGKYFFHLLCLHLADKLDKSYARQIQIFARAIKVINERTASLIQQNKELLNLLRKNNISYTDKVKIDQDQALSIAISNIKETLSLLVDKENQGDLHKLGLT